MMDTLAEDILTTLEDVPNTIHGIESTRWKTHHLFYNNSGIPLGVGGMNRGRCPFVRFFRGSREFNIQSLESSGGTQTTRFVMEIVTNKKPARDQEGNWDLAYQIWGSFFKELKELPNWRDVQCVHQTLQLDPLCFVLQIELIVINSFPCGEPEP